jgi:GNAT superfamily N-acetyltransferase
MQEAVGLAFGRPDLARALGGALIRLPNSPSGWERTVFAVHEERPVGVLQAGPDEVSFTSYVTLPVVWRVLRIFGPVKAVRGIPRIRARGRIDFDAVPDAYGVHELHVDPVFRNRGIGKAMLSYAEADARRLGSSRMALTTTTSNPARRLYEREGYRIVETKTDPAYERYTGIAGRHLLVKELT